MSNEQTNNVSKKMRVLIVMHGLFPGYVAPIPKEIAKNLYKQGVDIEVAAIGDGLSPNGEDLRFKVTPITAKGIVAQYKALLPLIKEFDIVHYFPGKGLELLPLFNRRVRFIYNFISVSVSGRPFFDWVVNKLKKVQPIFADLSLYTDIELQNNLLPFYTKKLGVMPVGFADDLFYPCSPYQESEKRLLIYHGSCHPNRKIEEMIKVMPLIAERYELMIIGKGSGEYINSLKTLAADLKCAHRIRFAEMPQNEIRTFIEKAYLCFSYVPVIDSYQDQFVLKTIEYLACGRPVLSTNTRYTNQFQRLVGERNLLVSKDDTQSMADAINSSEAFVNAFYNDEELKKLYAITDKYSNQSFIRERLLPYYTNLLKK